MITFMRRYRRGLQVGLLVVIAAFVASLFIFGSQGVQEGGQASVATVNGRPIPVERYQRRYREVVNLYAQMLRERFTPDMADRLGVPQQVVEDLVQEELAVERARTEGLTVTDAELNAHIHAFPHFQEGGRFTLRRYEEGVRRLGYTKAAFEDEMRRRLTRMKVETVVRNGVKVSAAEVEQAFVQQREEVRALWALVDLAPLVQAAPAGDEEIQAHLKEHPAEFREPERRRIHYVTLNPKDFLKPVADAEVEKYYTEHAATFEVPRQVRAAHILVRVPEVGGSQAEDKAREAVAGAIRRVRAGEDFGKVARELSQDQATAQQGGDLGFVSRGEMVKPFEDAVFALGKGAVSPEPVRTPFGFHAVTVTDVREGGRKPLKEVAPQIRERLAGDAADRAARARADEVRARLMGAADFMAGARGLGLVPVEATVARRPPGLAPPDPLEETAFELAPGGVAPPVKTPAGWVVMKQVQVLPAGVPPLADIRDRVAAAVKRRKAWAQAEERARQLAAEARADFAAAAGKVGAVVGETSRFSRIRPDERLPGDAMVAALTTPVGAVTGPVKVQQGYYVLKVLERVPPDRGGLAAEREKLEKELLARKQGQAWQAWLTAARSGARVEITARLPGRSG